MNTRCFAVRLPQLRHSRCLHKAVVNSWHVMICLCFAFILSGETAVAFAPYFYDVRLTGKIDAGGDGYARQFNIEFDVDSDTSGWYYVRVYEDDGGFGFDDYAWFIVEERRETDSTSSCFTPMVHTAIRLPLPLPSRGCHCSTSVSFTSSPISTSTLVISACSGLI